MSGNSEIYWKKLLAMSTSVSGPSTAGGNGAPPKPVVLSQADQAWLESAIDELSGASDPVAILTSYMMEVKAKLMEDKVHSPKDEVYIENALVAIADLCEDIDLAKVFCSLHGLALVREVFVKCGDLTRKRAAHILANVAQNNETTQDQIVATTDFLDILIKFAVCDKIDQFTRKTYVSAISAIVRNNMKAFDKFISLDGFVKLAASALKADRHKNHVVLERICVALAHITRGLDVEDIKKHRIHWTLSELMLALELESECDGISYLIMYFQELRDEDTHVSKECLSSMKTRLDQYRLMMSYMM